MRELRYKYDRYFNKMLYYLLKYPLESIYSFAVLSDKGRVEPLFEVVTS